MKIALAQLNPVIGDIAGNTARLIEFVARALSEKADLVVFPEQSVLGYPAKDLLLREAVISANVAAVQRLAQHARGISVIVGFAEPNDQSHGRPVFNSAALLSDGAIQSRWRKRLLPTYDVFDEARYFEPAGPQPVVSIAGRKIGVTICEDLLSEDMQGRPLYAADPVADLAAAGAELLLNISASPFVLGKPRWRIQRMRERAMRHGLPIAYVNQVGGNDELLFDGASCLVMADGRLVGPAQSFEEDLWVCDLDHPEAASRAVTPEGVAALHGALVMGLRDYVRKCGFNQVVVGLSGGIDSAVVATLAAEALGPENVLGVAMPSRISSLHSVEDARQLAENLRIPFRIIPIEELHAAAEKSLQPHFGGRPPDVAEENVQARARGLILMALSNKFGSMLLTTGNKSEVAVGYCTLYGDMCGGLAVISDVPKTMVYTLARHLNERCERPPIPESSLTKPPSAELRPNQTDQDSLPPYETLDAILEGYEEHLLARQQVEAAGFDRETVGYVLHKIHMSEYKRQQAAPGLKVTSRAFGFGRRMPIAARIPLG